MELLRDYFDTIRERAQRESAFCQALLREGIELMFGGDFDTGISMLRNYINATSGFVELARKTDIPLQSLQRMFGPKGNPRAAKLFRVIRSLLEAESVSVVIKLHPSTEQTG